MVSQLTYPGIELCCAVMCCAALRRSAPKGNLCQLPDSFGSVKAYTAAGLPQLNSLNTLGQVPWQLDLTCHAVLCPCCAVQNKFLSLAKTALAGSKQPWQQAYLSIVASDLLLQVPWQLDARHPVLHASHLLTKHLRILHLLTCPLQAQQTVSRRSVAVSLQPCKL